MDKYLITGFSGFVSRHFIEYLNNLNVNCQIVGIDIHNPEFDYSNYAYLKCRFEKIDLLNSEEVEDIIFNFQPNYILHLASFSSVAYSWQNPMQSFKNNTNIFLNLIDKVRLLDIKCRILSIGSSEEYGKINQVDLPLKETNLINPLSPYAVARVAQEQLSKVYIDGFGLDIIITRSFNHIGPYQKEIFAIPSFVKQLVDIKKEKKTKELVTGDISIIRDFIDVRDVVKAYYLLFQKGKKGEVYNICSGIGNSLETIIHKITKNLDIEIEIKTNKQLIRPNDNAIIIGSNQKIFDHIGWKPEFTVDDSINEIIKYWQNYESTF